ncbi:MAG: TIGR00159 family protein [Phycisphaerales bacterium]|nr:diadenylate cyclase CdaA [Phycisphaerae bacterium]NNF44741.1 TIGR00159 family protein [Phycisphaerales bacterium]NNM25483.1 TIGR00159 family protein [Phycisphaerales bacterium]
MARLWQQLFPGTVPWQAAIEIAVIWLCVYFVFRFLRGTRGAGVIRGVVVLVVIATLSIRMLGQSSDAFLRLNFIYDRFLGLLAVLLIVVFQPELRQAMSRLGRAWSFRPGREQVDSVIDAVNEAVLFLSKSQFGALIALERSTELGGLIETGARLDAKVDARLLESIFWPNSPLHDLGVVIRGDRILAASVQFPLVEEGVLPLEYGSRHRAAAGLSQESDCLVIIVSEETGAISIAERGVIEHAIGRDQFRSVLARRLDALTPNQGLDPLTSDRDPDEKQAA